MRVLNAKIKVKLKEKLFPFKCRNYNLYLLKYWHRGFLNFTRQFKSRQRQIYWIALAIKQTGQFYTEKLLNLELWLIFTLKNSYISRLSDENQSHCLTSTEVFVSNSRFSCFQCVTSLLTRLHQSLLL